MTGRVARRGSAPGRVGCPPLAWLAAALCVAAPCRAAEVAVLPSEARRAERLAGEARALSGREAALPRARALLRAYRWDPSRREELVAAIGELERIDPQAALRHAGLLLGTGGEPPDTAVAVLRRVRGLVRPGAPLESWRHAARVSAGLAATASAREEPADRVADLWLEAGLAHLTAGEPRAASAALEKFQRLGGGSRVAGEVPWSRVVEAHLEADEPVRAAGPLGFLAAAAESDTAVAIARARVALLMGEPLTAIDHARDALAAAMSVRADEAELIAAGRVLLDALAAANQASRGEEELAALGPGSKSPRADGARAAAFGLLRVEAIERAGDLRAAAEAAQAELLALLADTPPHDAARGVGSVPDDAPVLAELAARRLALAVEQRAPLGGLGVLPLVAERLGSADPLTSALSEAARDEGFRAAAKEWARGYAAREPDAGVPAGARRAAFRVALCVGASADAARLVAARLESLAGAGADAVEREAYFATIDLLDAGAAGEAASLARAALASVERAGGEGRSRKPSPARIRAALAEALALGDDRSGRPEAGRLAREAAREAPADAGVLQSALRAAATLGDVPLVERLAAQRLALAAGPDGPAADGDRREALRLLASTLRERNRPGDRARALETLEELLDGWPEDAAALADIAQLLLSDESAWGRAERSARRAVELAPESPRTLAALGGTLLARGAAAEEASTWLAAALARVSATDPLSPNEETLARRRLAAALRAQGRAEEAAAGSE